MGSAKIKWRRSSSRRRRRRTSIFPTSIRYGRRKQPHIAVRRSGQSLEIKMEEKQQQDEEDDEEEDIYRNQATRTNMRSAKIKWRRSSSSRRRRRRRTSIFPTSIRYGRKKQPHIAVRRSGQSLGEEEEKVLEQEEGLKAKKKILEIEKGDRERR
jgi:hypothetical protein